MSWLLVLAIGGHWPLLQSLAWVNMLVTYSQRDGFAAAVEKTFDGEHPCTLCSFVKKGKDSEQKQPVKLSALKIDLFLVSQESFLIKLPRNASTAFVSSDFAARSRLPLLPPPKTA